jgi:DNA-binding phage protein
MNAPFEIREYIEGGRSPFAEWFDSLDSVTARGLTVIFADWNREISARPKHCAQACPNCGWISVRAIACISVATEGSLSSCCAAEANGGRTRTSPPRLLAGSDTNRRRKKNNMALTREYKKTVVARIQRDKNFARALYAEALNALFEGETEEGLSMLRDLVHAEISFKELAQQTGLGEKALHRMLSRRGNPTTRNLFTVTKAICESLAFKPRVAFGTN